MSKSLSIIIPSYNEERLLSVCLNSILQQKNELGPTGEIIVVVNGSTDGTLKIALSYAKNNQIIKVLNLKQANKKMAMNAAMDIALNRYLLFCDADSFLDKNALFLVKKKIQKERYAIVGAIRRPIVDNKKVNISFPETYYMLHYARRLSLKTEERLSIQGWLMAIDLNKFGHLRFPHDNSADDIWLSAYTWSLFGQKSIGYISKAIGTYVPPATLEDMESQLLRHRSNHKTVQQSHPELASYFLVRKKYYTSLESNLRWKLNALSLGIHFDTWITAYQEFLTSIDTKVATGEYDYNHQTSWDRISSTKVLRRK